MKYNSKYVVPLSLQRPKVSFWITNISKSNVVLSDLNLTIYSFTSVNLMDTKHYSYSLEQLETSFASGSLFKKRHLLRRREKSPDWKEPQMTVSPQQMPSRQRSVEDVKEKIFEELMGEEERKSEEALAEQNADLEIGGNK